MSVPKAALDADDRLEGGKDEVGTSWKILGVPLEADIKIAERTSHGHLRLRALGADEGHDFGPLPLAEYVGHRRLN